MIDFVAVHTYQIDNIWPRVEHLIDKAVGYADGEASLKSIYHKLKTGEYVLLIVFEGDTILSALTLHIHDFEGEKFMYIGFAGGERLDEWHEPLLEAIEKIAREQGAKRLRIQGRRGWLRKLKNDGFKEIEVTISKEL